MATDHLSPAQAASRAKCGRSTIMRALDKEELRAVRNNRGHWKIAPEALEDWMSMRPDHPNDQANDRSGDRHSPEQVTDTDHGQELVTARVEIASLTAERDGLASRLADAHAERDWLRTELARSQEPLLARIRRSLTGRSGA